LKNKNESNLGKYFVSRYIRSHYILCSDASMLTNC